MTDDPNEDSLKRIADALVMHLPTISYNLTQINTNLGWTSRYASDMNMLANSNTRVANALEGIRYVADQLKLQADFDRREEERTSRSGEWGTVWWVENTDSGKTFRFDTAEEAIAGAKVAQDAGRNVKIFSTEVKTFAREELPESDWNSHS